MAGATGVAMCASVVAAASPATVASAATAQGHEGFGRTPRNRRRVSILGGSGAGALRAAIEAADSAAGNHDGHHFSVNGTITLASALPAITNEAIIAGTSAPTYTADGAPVVEINCDGHAGLRFSAGLC